MLSRERTAILYIQNGSAAICKEGSSMKIEICLSCMRHQTKSNCAPWKNEAVQSCVSLYMYRHSKMRVLIEISNSYDSIFRKTWMPIDMKVWKFLSSFVHAETLLPFTKNR